MKKPVRSYISFSTADKRGLLALGLLLLGLVTVKGTMQYWVHPTADTASAHRLQQQWLAFKKEHEVQPDTTELAEAVAYRKKSDKSDEPLPLVVNINTADSATLVRFKGIGPVTAHRILMRRSTVGPFTDVDQLRALGRFNAETFAALKKHLVVR